MNTSSTGSSTYRFIHHEHIINISIHSSRSSSNHQSINNSNNININISTHSSSIDPHQSAVINEHISINNSIIINRSTGSSSRSSSIIINISIHSLTNIYRFIHEHIINNRPSSTGSLMIINQQYHQQSIIINISTHSSTIDHIINRNRSEPSSNRFIS